MISPVLSANINYNTLLSSMLDGAGTTLQIFFLTLIIGLPMGLVVCAGRMSGIKPVRWLVSLLLLVIRGTPLILQIVFFYFGPYFLLGMRGMDRFLAVIIAFGLNYACYFAEIYRTGLEAIDIGQDEAAAALGFTKSQTFFKIKLPQVIKIIVPTMGSEFMTLVKDTSLARIIAVVEIFNVAERSVNTYASITPLVVAGVFYLVMNTVVQQGFLLLEKKLSYYR